jgi:hypothetical protein
MAEMRRVQGMLQVQHDRLENKAVAGVACAIPAKPFTTM